MVEKFICSKDSTGFNYIDVIIVKDDKKYKFRTLVRTGSEYTIFSAQRLNVDTTNLKKIKAAIGFEEIDIYEVPVDSIAIGKEDEGILVGMDHIYVSDLEYFQNTPVLGMDYLSNMDISSNPEKGMVLEFDPAHLHMN